MQVWLFPIQQKLTQIVMSACAIVCMVLLLLISFSHNCYAQATSEVLETLSAIPSIHAREGRDKPVIAIIAENRFTELTDYVIPYAVLKQANIADVFALGMQEGTIQMFPALRLRAQFSAAQFDALHPTGADIVIVPAVHYSEDAALLSWVKTQAKKGATVVGICDGVWVLAHAGLLEQRQAVGHWYSFDDLSKQFPRTRFVKDKRYLADGNVVTTTGVSASLPASLALVEAIAGKAKARSVAAELGVSAWSAEHQSADFKLSAKHIWTASLNWLAFWNKDQFIIPLTSGVDELTLALTADAFSRTYRSGVLSYAKEAITSLRGLQIEPDTTQPTTDEALLELPKDRAPGQSLEWALQRIAQRYGERLASFVALQMEYPYGTKK